MHPDEYWQSTEVAYKAVYHDQQDFWMPWEWSDNYRLRSWIYPMYLSLPLRFVRFLGFDTNLVVRCLPYFAHLPIVLLCDYFFWKILKRVLLQDAARLGFALYFFNRYMQMYLIRTFTNSLETTFTTVAFYFYLDQKDKLTLNTVILTAFISFSFMIRTTSPVGWIPLLAYKVLFEGSFIPFIKSGILVAIPICCLCIFIDTTLYGAD